MNEAVIIEREDPEEVVDPAQLTLELPLEDSVKLVHPNLYGVIHPNVLIGTATSQFTLVEHKLYTEILSIDHKLEPSKFVYRLPYLSVYERSKNPGRNIQRLSESIRGQRLKLPLEYAKKVYGDEFNLQRSEIASFITINYRSGYIDVELHPQLKKLLVLTKSYYTKGELELLRSFTSEYSYKIYWIIRKTQPFRNTLEIPMDEFRSLLGIEDKYKQVDNLTRRVLKPAEDDLEGTWAAFGFSYIIDGKKAVGVKLYFKSDKKLNDYIGRDIRYEFEKNLANAGVDISHIMALRKKIVLEEIISEKVSDMRWNAYYISRTIQEANSNKKVRHLAAFIVDSLNKHRFLKLVEGEVNDLIKDAIHDNPLGHKIKEGVQIRKKVLKRSALYKRSEYEQDAANFDLSLEEHLDNIGHHVVKLNGKYFSVSKELVPDDVKSIDDWKIVEDLDY